MCAKTASLCEHIDCKGQTLTCACNKKLIARRLEENDTIFIGIMYLEVVM